MLLNLTNLSSRCRGEKSISHGNIDYIKASDDYSTIFYGKEKAIVSISLKDIETLFSGEQFIRVHKSYIVHKRKIKSFRSGKTLLQSNISIPIGRTYRIPDI